MMAANMIAQPISSRPDRAWCRSSQPPRAEMTDSRLMMSEARAYIRAVSEGIRSCRDVESVMVAISDDFVVRYADNLESYLNTDDVLGGFGKKA